MDEASRSVAYRGAALWTRDYQPTLTTADTATDMALAADLARSFGVTLPVGSAVLAQLAAADCPWAPIRT